MTLHRAALVGGAPLLLGKAAVSRTRLWGLWRGARHFSSAARPQPSHTATRGKAGIARQTRRSSAGPDPSQNAQPKGPFGGPQYRTALFALRDGNKMFLRERVMTNESGRVVRLLPTAFLSPALFWDEIRSRVADDSLIIIGEARGSTQHTPRQGVAASKRPSVIPNFFEEFPQKEVKVLLRGNRLALSKLLTSSAAMKELFEKAAEEAHEHMAKSPAKQVAILFDAEGMDVIYNRLREDGYSDFLQEDLLYGHLDSSDVQESGLVGSLYMRMFEPGKLEKNFAAILRSLAAAVCLIIVTIYCIYSVRRPLHSAGELPQDYAAPHPPPTGYPPLQQGGPPPYGYPQQGQPYQAVGGAEGFPPHQFGYQAQVPPSPYPTNVPGVGVPPQQQQQQQQQHGGFGGGGAPEGGVRVSM